MPRLFTTLIGAHLATAFATTCGNVKEFYQDQSCCSNADSSLSVPFCPEVSTNGVLKYFGIQYATAPRFRKPIVKPFSMGACGTYAPGADETICTQGDAMVDTSLGGISPTRKGVEDCLFLDIYTKNKANMPVVVLFHGGGFQAAGNHVYEPIATSANVVDGSREAAVPMTEDHDVVQIQCSTASASWRWRIRTRWSPTNQRQGR